MMAENVVQLIPARSSARSPMQGSAAMVRVIDEVQLSDGSVYTQEYVLHLAGIRLSAAAHAHFRAMAAARGCTLEALYSSLLEELAADDMAAESGAAEAATEAPNAAPAGESA